MKKEVDAVTKLYDFILYMIPKLEKFPKNQKFLLGDRIETALLDTLEILIEAAYTRQKTHLLTKANLRLERLRYLLRLCKDLKLVNLKTYETAAKSIDAVGVSVGGWLRYSRREAPQPSV